MAEIRRIRPDEWRLLREVRLRALATDPDAFASSLEREEGREDAWWQEWSGYDAGSDSDATFLAWEGDAVVGMAAGFARDENVTVVAMWVAPAVRGGGTGRALLKAVEAWAFARGAAATDLFVTNENPAAQRFYENCGYVTTGGTQPLERDPSVVEIAMRKRRP